MNLIWRNKILLFLLNVLGFLSENLQRQSKNINGIPLIFHFQLWPYWLSKGFLRAGLSLKIKVTRKRSHIWSLQATNNNAIKDLMLELNVLSLISYQSYHHTAFYLHVSIYLNKKMNSQYFYTQHITVTRERILLQMPKCMQITFIFKNPQQYKISSK